MGSRQLFLRARKWCHSPHHKHTPWQVYAAAAALEWQVCVGEEGQATQGPAIVAGGDGRRREGQLFVAAAALEWQVRGGGEGMPRVRG